uniref:AAA+ ATPase domain-containing protein n=2 Tax=Kalanchoe fedtschenkoi TaxID=63787 RepID=A0A7N0RDF7_KALFE
MTRDFRDRVLKDANGDISDHLRNHIHLTNCIHLKNHMHKHSPTVADRSFMRDLMVLQRSRSLRDPSATPRSWHSASVVAELLAKTLEKDEAFQEGRRSVGNERYRNEKAALGNLAHMASSKVAPGEEAAGMDDVAVANDRSGKSSGRRSQRIRREETSKRSANVNILAGEEEGVGDVEWPYLGREAEAKGKKAKLKGKESQDHQHKTLPGQLNEVGENLDGMESSDGQFQNKSDKIRAAREANITGNGAQRGRRRKVRGARRNRAITSRAQNGASVAANSVSKTARRPRLHTGREEELSDNNVTGPSRNGCGIPWNWSRIHNRSRNFLDMAGRSLSCGLTDPRLKKAGTSPQGRDVSNMPLASDQSDSNTKSDGEALPLLVEASGSQANSDSAAWAHEYSGELGIFSNHMLKRDLDSDYTSEARSGDRQVFGKYRNSRHHQSLTQKYMPRTFKDLVGQHLVAQALSNAIARRKVGFLYVFHGPHGTGKTSCARIFARALNCQSVDEPRPCGFCNSCIAYDMGKSHNIQEVGPVSRFDFEGIMDQLESMVILQAPSQYRVFIFDDCDTLSADCWSAISKVVDRAPRRVVFILACSSLEVLPHIIISRCQKFFFPKLKDADIIFTLQWIARKEHLEIDSDAVKLIVSRSDGSLRDAEMTLEQLSLLGQEISISLVQELVGLISDEKLVDLLDLAISADTVNTVKSLREIMETGVEPLALMSQLATVITDLLAGGYDFTKDRQKRKFFKHETLSKEDTEKLRQALKTLSEAEKQLRTSNDKLTWLTAALLQLAPDQQYMLPGSSADASFNHSPLLHKTSVRQDVSRRDVTDYDGTSNFGKRLSTRGKTGNLGAGTSQGLSRSRLISEGKRYPEQGAQIPRSSPHSADRSRNVGSKALDQIQTDVDEIWLDALENIQANSIKQFMYQEGKLVSVSFGTAPVVQLMFSSHIAKSKAEKLSAHIIPAFESVVGSPLKIELRCDVGAGCHMPIVLSASEARPQFSRDPEPVADNRMQLGRSEIVEIPASPVDPKSNSAGSVRRDPSVAGGGKPQSPNRRPVGVSLLERRTLGENPNRSIVKSKVSLAHVIQQAEGCSQRSGWSRRKAVSIADKLEQENLRLESKSRSLFCWKAPGGTSRKLGRLRVRTRRPKALLKVLACGKCMTTRSPR